MKSRPTTIDELNALFDTLSAEPGEVAGGQFRPKPTDIIISPYNKSGTTWLQQIVHGLRTRGDMAFDDISRVVPWIEMSAELGIDIDAPQRALPRAFKSHHTWHDVPKGGRYIVSIRDPKDVLVSSFRFMEGWFFERGSIPLEDYARRNYLTPSDGEGYWQHLLSWWPQRNQETVLLLSFQAMKRDLPGTVQRVAEFIGVGLDDALLELVVRQSSFAFMRAHVDRFDDRLMRERSERVYGLPPGSESSKVREGQIGSHKVELSDGLREELDQIWRQTVTPVLGFDSFEALDEVLGNGSNYAAMA